MVLVIMIMIMTKKKTKKRIVTNCMEIKSLICNYPPCYKQNEILISKSNFVLEAQW